MIRRGAQPVPENLSPEARAVQRKLHQTIKRVSDDFQGRWHFNTCIAAIMELVNELYAAEVCGAGDSPANLPAPCCARSSAPWLCCSLPSPPTWPTSCGKCWAKRRACCALPGRNTIQRWPKKMKLRFRCRSTAKLRSRIVVPADASEDLVRERARADDKIGR